MRRYSIVSRILLILSVIDFALAAPVLVQRRQASVDVVHIPEDAITVRGKRGNGLEEMGEEFLKTLGKPKELSAGASSSNSAPPGPDHGSTNVVEAPQSNPASSTANQDHSLMGANTQPSNPGSQSPALEEYTMWEPPPNLGRLNMPPPGGSASIMDVYRPPADPWFTQTGYGSPEKMYTPASSEHGSGDEFYTIPLEPNPANRWTPAEGPPPQKPASPADSFDWNHWQSVEDPPLKKPGSPTDSFDWNHWQSVEDPPPSKPAPLPDSFDWERWKSEHPLSTEIESPTDVPPLQLARPPTPGRPGVGLASGFHSDDQSQVANPPSPGTVSEFLSAHGPPDTVSEFSSGHGSPYAPPTTPEALTSPGPETETSKSAWNTLNSDNLPDVNYALKGKAKVPGGEEQPEISHGPGA